MALPASQDGGLVGAVLGDQQPGQPDPTGGLVDKVLAAKPDYAKPDYGPLIPSLTKWYGGTPQVTVSPERAMHLVQGANEALKYGHPKQVVAAHLASGLKDTHSSDDYFAAFKNPGSIDQVQYSKLNLDHDTAERLAAQADCSLFTQRVMQKQFGVKVPRTAIQQYRSTPMVLNQGEKDFSRLQPGDLIFFDNGLRTPFNTQGKAVMGESSISGYVNHVGIYAGNGVVVHDPGNGTVKEVPLGGLLKRMTFMGATRPAPSGPRQTGPTSSIDMSGMGAANLVEEALKTGANPQPMEPIKTKNGVVMQPKRPSLGLTNAELAQGRLEHDNPLAANQEWVKQYLRDHQPITAPKDFIDLEPREALDLRQTPTGRAVSDKIMSILSDPAQELLIKPLGQGMALSTEYLGRGISGAPAGWWTDDPSTEKDRETQQAIGALAVFLPSFGAGIAGMLRVAPETIGVGTSLASQLSTHSAQILGGAFSSELASQIIQDPKEAIKGLWEQSKFWEEGLTPGQRATRFLTDVMLVFGGAHGAVKTWQAGKFNLAARQLSKGTGLPFMESRRMLKALDQWTNGTMQINRQSIDRLKDEFLNWKDKQVGPKPAPEGTPALPMGDQPESAPKATPKAPTPPTDFKLGKATWAASDADHPINVTGYLGMSNGRHYVLVEGSKAGVPLDEIQYPKQDSVETALDQYHQAAKEAGVPEGQILAAKMVIKPWLSLASEKGHPLPTFTAADIEKDGSFKGDKLPETPAEPAKAPDQQETAKPATTETDPEVTSTPTPSGIRFHSAEGYPFYETRMPTSEIGVKKGLQYKQSEVIDAENQVSGRYKNVDVYDEGAGDPLTVWQDRDGKTWVVNGHHRLEIAKRTGHPSLPVKVFRESEGISFDEARALGALQNIKQGKGTAIDAVAVLKDLGYGPADLKRLGVSAREDVVRNAVAMLNLPQEAIDMVRNGSVTEPAAAAIGEAKLSPERSVAAMKVAMDNGIETRKGAAFIAEKARTAPMIEKGGDDLFGDVALEMAWGQQAKISERVINRLVSDERLFKAITKGKAVGSTVVDEASQTHAAVVQEFARKVLASDAEVARILETEATEYAKNPTPARLNTAVERVSDAAKSAAERRLAGLGQTQPGAAAKSAESRLQSGTGDRAPNALVDVPEDFALESPKEKPRPQPKAEDSSQLSLSPEHIGDKTGQLGFGETLNSPPSAKTETTRKSTVTLYHGTNQPFEGTPRAGTWWTSDKESAGAFARHPKSGPARTVAHDFTLSKVLDLSDREVGQPVTIAELAQKFVMQPEELLSKLTPNERGILESNERFGGTTTFVAIDNGGIGRLAKELGYDAIKASEKVDASGRQLPTYKVFAEPKEAGSTKTSEAIEKASAQDSTAEGVTVPALVRNHIALADELASLIAKGEPINWRDLTKLADQHFGGSQVEGKYDARDMYDALEVAVNKHIASAHPDLMSLPSEKAVEILKKIEQVLPTQTNRTDTQLSLQQFSTPPTEAYALVKGLGDIRGKRALEPSAGTGSIANMMRLAGADVTVNEYHGAEGNLRAGLLQAQGFKVTRFDAERIDAFLNGQKFDVVGMNPPFSSTGGRVKNNQTRFGGMHVESAMRLVAPGGRLGAIVGGGMSASSITHADWFRAMASKYAYVANILVDGSDYAKYGTTFDNRVLIFDRSDSRPTVVQSDRALKTTELAEKLTEIGNASTADRSPIGERSPQAASGTRAGVEPVTSGDREPRNAASDTRRQPERLTDSGRAKPDAGGQRGRTSSDGGAIEARADDRGAVPEPRTDALDANQGSEVVRGVSDRGDDRESSQPKRTPAVKVSKALKETIVPDEDTEPERFETYRSEVKGASHPTALVETGSMAGVKSPLAALSAEEVSKLVHFPQSIIERGAVSDAQLEPIVLAALSHTQRLTNGSVKGTLIGDGTGVGKGREIAAIAVNNWFEGNRRILWLTADHKKLASAAERDFDDVAGKGAIPMSTIDKHSAKEGQNGVPPIQFGDGVIIVGYDTLKMPGRLPQLIEWMKGGKGAPVMLFDEAHKAAGAFADGRGEASKRGKAVIDIQESLPDARVVYATATAADRVSNIAYMTRLGLWGPGTNFENFTAFKDFVESAGIAGAEMLAREMKAMGLYTSRFVAFKNPDGSPLEYDEINVDPSPEMVEMYDKAAEAWSKVLNFVEENVKNKNLSKNERDQFMTNYWSAHQRFFKSLTSAFKAPELIRQLERAIDEGFAPVVALDATNEANQERALQEAKIAGIDIGDIDFTNKDAVRNMVKSLFPTQLTQEMTDDATGQTLMVPVWRNQRTGETKLSMFDPGPEWLAIEDPMKAAMRDELMAEVGDLKVPGNALDELILHFGPDNVAEISGRTKRIVRNPQTGEIEVQRISKPKGAEGRDPTDYEIIQFQAGKRQIAIITRAGAQGISLHADATAKNQKQRKYFLFEPGWNTKDEIQKLGRVHRSGQVIGPKYSLMSIDIGGEKRFSSALAAKLAQLGAMQRGDRSSAGAGELAKYDFNSDYGHTAALQALNALSLGQKKTMGLLDSKGNLKVEGTPEQVIGKFFNRLLVLPVAQQRTVYSRFEEAFHNAVEHAKINGQFADTVTDIKAIKVTHKGAEVVYKDKQSGATSELHTLELELANKRITWDQARSILESADGRFYTNNQSGNVALVVRYGPPADTRYKAIFPNGRTAYNIVPYELYQRFTDITGRMGKESDNLPREMWEKALEATPPTRIEPAHVITGLVLPIRHKLAGKSEPVRIQIQGERVVGMMLDQTQIGRSLRDLGAGHNVEAGSPESIYLGAMDDMAAVDRIKLAGGLEIKRGMFQGSKGLEVLANDVAYSMRASAIANILDAGVIKTGKFGDIRYFIPSDSVRGPEVLSRILEHYNVVEMPDSLKSDTLHQMPETITSPAFRRWFGDSKAVDESGEPLVFYHGTRRSFDRFDITGASDRALYGPGIYVTSDAEVAGGLGGAKSIEEAHAKAEFNMAGYAFQAPEYELGQPLTKRQRYQIRRNIEGGMYDAAIRDIGARRSYNDAVRALQSEEPGALEKWLANRAPRWIVERLKATPQQTTRPQVLPLYVSVKNPFDMDAEPSAATVTRFRDAIAKRTWDGADGRTVVQYLDQRLAKLESEDIPVTGEQLYKSILSAGAAAANRGNGDYLKPIVTEMLKDLGYDGIMHTGGKIVGNRLHQVFIAFSPEQVKSAIGNRGTFDPSDPSLLNQGPKGSYNLKTQIVQFMKGKADVSTMIHEPAHWFEDFLRSDASGYRQVMEEEYGPEPTRSSRERFARHVEGYFRNPNANIPGRLKAAFQALVEWLKDIYKNWRYGETPESIKKLLDEVHNRPADDLDLNLAKDFDDWLKKQETPEAAVEKPEAAEKPTVENGDILTGARKAITEVENKNLGTPEVVLQRYQVPKEAYEAGKAAVNLPEGAPGRIDPKKLAIEVSRTPRQISGTEIGALAYDRARMMNTHAQFYSREIIEASLAGDRASLLAHRDELEHQLHTNYEALRKGGRENSAALNAMKMAVAKDYSYQSVRTDFMAYSGGKAPSEKVDTLMSEWSTKEAGYQVRIRRLQSELSRMQADQNVRLSAHTPRQRDPRASVERALKRYRAGTLNQDELHQEAEPELVQLVKDLEAAGYQAGIASLKEMIRFITKAAASEVPDLSEDVIIDVLAGKYNDPSVKSPEAEAKSEVRRTAKAKAAAAEAKEKAARYKEAQKELSEAKAAKDKEWIRLAQEALDDVLADMEPAAKQQARKSKELQEAQDEARLAQVRLDQLRVSQRPHNWAEKIIHLEMEGVISSPGVFVKIPAAGFLNSLFRTVADPTLGVLAGKVRVKGKSLAEISGNEGNVTKESFVHGLPFADLRKGWSRAVVAVRDGIDPHQAIAHPDSIPRPLGGITKWHVALHQFQMAAEYEKHLALRTQVAIRSGKDMTDADVLNEIRFEAAYDAMYEGFRGDNWMSTYIDRPLMRAISDPNVKKDPSVETKRTLAFIAKTFLPVVKLAANIAHQTLQFTGAGLAEGAYRTLRANLSDTPLTPRQADTIIRALVKGGVGLGIAVLVMEFPDEMRGMLKWIEDVSIGGVPMGKLLSHHPVIEAAHIQMAARDAYQPKVTRTGKSHGGAEDAMKAALKEWSYSFPGVPAVEMVGGVASGTQNPSKATARWAQSFVPGSGALRWVAGLMDKGPDGKPMPRKTSGFLDTLGLNVPFVRNRLPVNENALKHEKH